jgi:hypothetical protein
MVKRAIEWNAEVDAVNAGRGAFYSMMINDAG